MSAKDFATLSRKLNDREYKNKEKAVTAMPAVRIWLMVWMPVNTAADKSLIMLFAFRYYFNNFAKNNATS
jgi:hypothetical protein